MHAGQEIHGEGHNLTARSSLALRFTYSSTSRFTHFPSSAPGGVVGDIGFEKVGDRGTTTFDAGEQLGLLLLGVSGGLLGVLRLLLLLLPELILCSWVAFFRSVCENFIRRCSMNSSIVILQAY